MKTEDMGEIFIDGRIIGLDNTSVQDLESILEQINTQNEKIINKLNIVLAEIQ